MARDQAETPEVARVHRLKLLRALHGYGGERQQSAFAAFLGISYTRWNNYECGYPMTRDIEDLLVRITPGLSVDWIRHGESRTLTVDLSRRLHELEAGKGRSRAS